MIRGKKASAIFYSSYILFWIILAIYPLYFGDPIYEDVLFYGSLAFRTCFLFIAISYLFLKTRRARSCLLLMGLYCLFAQIADLLFIEIMNIYYLLETLIFFSWVIWLLRRPEFKTAETIDHNNILLAFYKGKKGSFLMNFFELFGLPVKSMCIIAGDKALYLKTNRKTFQFGDSAKIHKKASDYIIIDTGKPHTKKFIYEMKKYSRVLASKGILRIRCIEGVSDLLGMIGHEWKPKTNIPSLYLRSIINE